eukprot:scaffold4882_cov79-Cylindrotheca_fusiformis.AAC.2
MDTINHMLVEFTARVKDAVMDIGSLGNKPSTLNYDDDEDGITSLHAAVISGHADACRWLLAECWGRSRSRRSRW